LDDIGAAGRGGAGMDALAVPAGEERVSRCYRAALISVLLKSW
jgi:hypothetical protein